MKTIAIINLKGGVGKSITAIHVACELPGQQPGARVLVVDLDKQANTTKFFDRLDYDKPSAADLLTGPADGVHSTIRGTDFSGVDLIPANMQLLLANKMVLMDCTRRQQDRLAKALARVSDDYDYCILDCPPDIDMATINALCAAEYVIIPIDCDEWALDGLEQITQQIDTVRAEYNPQLALLGCLVTKYTRTRYARETVEKLAGTGLPVFASVIRYTTKVKQAKAAHKPVTRFCARSPAALDYIRLTGEIIRKVSGVDTERRA